MRSLIVIIIAGIAALIPVLPLLAQSGNPVYVNASELTITGRPQPVSSGYHRVDTARYPELPAAVKRLLTNSAGIAVSFITNSSRLAARWSTKGNTRPNMTAIAAAGLDLYIRRNGQWQFAAAGIPIGHCTTMDLVKNMDTSMKECLLYLPLYTELLSLDIGIDTHSMIRPGPEPFGKRVVIYGSSIVQGASASRPGMAYPARLSRASGFHFINMGVSGSAKMEEQVAEMLADIPAAAYVLDCVPNSSPQEIKTRTAQLVTTLRKRHPQAPIILIESIFRESGHWDLQLGRRVRMQNEAIRLQYAQLRKQGVQNLYLILHTGLLGNQHEGTVDGTHPNDLGFDHMLQKLQPAIINILRATRE